MNDQTTINVTVSAFIDGLTTRQKAYQNAILNGKNATHTKQDLEQLISIVDYYLETIRVPFSKNDPLEPLRRARGRAMHTLINN